MRRLVLAFLLSLGLAAAVFVPFPVHGQLGSYNTYSGLIWCRGRFACLHEIGHRIDQRKGWVSHSTEFSNAIRLYVLEDVVAGNGGHAVGRFIVRHPGAFSADPALRWTAESELYASLLAVSDGEPAALPPELRTFYDWDAVRSLDMETGVRRPDQMWLWWFRVGL